MSLTGIIVGLFFLGFCIFIHELGHFVAAKWRGLHIVAFSIGFKKVWSFKHKGIDYRIGCIPCGGYVDLPQIDATGEAKDEHGNPLPPAKPIDRIITAFAGPLFNIIFGILLSVIVWKVGVPQDTSNMRSIVVKELEEFSPEYNAGLRNNDVITQLNGQPFNCSWGDFVRTIIFTVGDVTLKVNRDGKVFDIKYKPAPNTKRTPEEKIAYPFFLPILPLRCEVEPDSAVAKAGMQSGDIIVRVNNRQILDVDGLRNALSMNRGECINFTVMRDGKLVELQPVKPIIHKKSVYRTGVLISDSFNAEVVQVSPGENGDKTGFQKGDKILRVDGMIPVNEFLLGKIIEKNRGNKAVTFLLKRDKEILKISEKFPVSKVNANKKEDVKILYKYSTPFWFADVFAGSPAEKQGFKQYDRLIKLKNKPIDNFEYFVKTVKNSKGAPLPIVIERDGKILRKTIASKKFYPYEIDDIGLKLVSTVYPTPLQQFYRVITMTYNSIRGIYRGMFYHDSTLKPRHLSGPIGIFRVISITFSYGGIMPVIALIVLITYSLAILNLMPIPVLDGGHIVLALIEQFFGKPLSPKIVQPLFLIFVMLLIPMMLYVSFYDVLRFIGGKKKMESVTKEYRYLRK